MLHLRCSIENVTLVDWVELLKRRLAAATVAFYSGVARLLSVWSRRRLSLVVVDGDGRRLTLVARTAVWVYQAYTRSHTHTSAHTPNLTHKFTCESLLGFPLIYSCRALLAYEWYSSCVYQLVCAAHVCVCVCASVRCHVSHSNAHGIVCSSGFASWLCWAPLFCLNVIVFVVAFVYCL